MLTGEVRAVDAQQINTPPSNSSPVVLRYFLPEGTRVKPGDVLVRIDPGQAAATLRGLDAQIEQAQDKAAKEVAELRVKAVDAELAQVDADAALQTARVDTGIPHQLISSLDFDRYRGERERAERELALKARELLAARSAVDRRIADARLEVGKLTAERDYNQAQVQLAEVRADRGGVLVHAFDSQSETGGRYDEGSSSYPGVKIGEVVGDGPMAIRAYALEPDRVGLAAGQVVGLMFDALRGERVQGRITTIAGAPQPKAQWGDGRYYQIDIALPERSRLSLRPGMSVRVDTAPAKVGAPPEAIVVAAAHADSVRAEGEIIARQSAAISPPAIDGLWMMNITQLSADGAAVKKGEIVASFDGGQLAPKLSEKQSLLKEKQSQRAQLLLELDERQRNEHLATGEARANLDKAQRKASQPKDLVAGIDYRKLLIGLQQAQRRMLLLQRREQLAAEQRLQERRLSQAEVDQLQADVGLLLRSIAALNVVAPRAGVMLHKTGWDGQKFDIGSQAWRGQSIAQIPDLATLAVRADLAERDLTRVALGAKAAIRVEGGLGATLRGNVIEIGHVVHSKSRVQPVPVVEVLIALEAGSARLRPGQPLRVEIAAIRAKTP